jgi:acyl transferase domain-containing protein/thioesterase domain-containing protein
MEMTVGELTGLEVAIIGMAGRFPGAPTIAAFWSNLRDGVESIATFTDDELQRSGVDPALLGHPGYVKASAVLDDIDLFDAAFFGYTPREAAMIDPQQRIFLECAWEALESAGYDSARYTGAIGVFAGAGFSMYLQSSQHFMGAADEYQAAIGNHHDFLATRVSYKLNLTGPSMTIQTACSTSLVAVHLACQSLISGDSDITLAGGVSIRVPQQAGYLYQPGGIMAPDAHCRAFDTAAQGIVIGSGAGVVVLKRLADALTDGDCIHAIIKGSAINNDGATKIGYTAPSEEGQARVIRAAHRGAEVAADTITYIEAHGTGTALGDPIEIAALTQAFQRHTRRQGFCAIGSVKTNIGHLDTAAGVAGLIKTVLALKQRQIPPSLHFVRPNPEIDFANSPFYVNSALAEWKASEAPRRAGVSALGVGGTNAHVILEEAAPAESPSESRPWQLLVLSAKTHTALDRATADLATHFRCHPDISLADAAYTLQLGRQMLKHRRMLICRDAADAQDALEAADLRRVLDGAAELADPRIVFLFPGQGSQYVQMAAGLYLAEPMFREQIDRCAEILIPHLGRDLREVLYPGEPRTENREPANNVPRTTDQRLLDQTWLTQPALFVVEYALARLWMSWGVRPWAMIGHSLGEYVAACLSGVFSLEDALALIAVRGRLMQQQPAGKMLAVALAEQELRPLLSAQLDLAAMNAPSMCVASGPSSAIEALRQQLAERGVDCCLLYTSHAFHSAAIEPVLAPFVAQFRTIELKAPQIPFISNVTGTWITAAEATDPQYWAQHLRQPVRFSAGVRTLMDDREPIFLEVGPGRTLSTLVRQHLGNAAGGVLLPSLRHADDQQADVACLLRALGQLWLAGVAVDWPQLYVHEQRRRVRLPTYPFERQRHWVEQHQPTDPHPIRQCAVSAPSQAVVADHARPDEPRAHSSSPAPRDERERTIAAIWQEVLGIAPIGVHDNFFDLGGDSLTAIHLLSRLGEALNVTLPSHSLFQTPTIAALAATCAGLVPRTQLPTKPKRPAALVELQPGNGRRPLFMVHPIGGGVYIYRDLACALGSDQPFYGLQSHDTDAEASGAGVANLAGRYVAAMRAVQPGGPYLIGGFSFGGAVAFEMAQQVHAAGERVALLTLLDTPWPGDLPDDLNSERAVMELALGADPGAAAAIGRIWQRAPEERLRACLEHAQSVQRFPANFGLPTFRRLIQMLTEHLHALRSYQPQTYTGQMLFFSASERAAGTTPYPELGWVPLALDGITIRRVGGSHTTMNYPPHVGDMGQQLRQLLDRA